MDTLKGIMIKYANERGGGLPLTPEEICNCVVLWAQQYAPTAITINGGEGVSINNKLVDDNKKVITININPATINVVELVGLFEGSDTVVVDVNDTNDKIEIHLDHDIITRISKSLVLPVSTPTEDVVPVVGVNGTQRYEPLSGLGGGGGGSGLFVHTYSLPNGEPRFKILTPISTNISPVGWNGVGLFTDTQKILDGAVYYFVQGGGSRREWQRAFNFTDDKGLTFTRISYNSSYDIAFLTDAIMDTQDLSEYVETIEPFTGGNM